MDGTALSLMLAAGALFTSAAALIVAVLDWRQVGREEPWALTKVSKDLWVLERVHRHPAVILSLGNFHGSSVELTSDADIIAGSFRRGRKEILYIQGSQLGTALEVSYRRDHCGVVRKIFGGPFEWMGFSHYPEGKGVKFWTSPLY
ncbi:hypothetical protein [Glutamicibacter protophormiae]